MHSCLRWKEYPKGRAGQKARCSLRTSQRHCPSAEEKSPSYSSHLYSLRVLPVFFGLGDHGDKRRRILHGVKVLSIFIFTVLTFGSQEAS